LVLPWDEINERGLEKAGDDRLQTKGGNKTRVDSQGKERSRTRRIKVRPLIFRGEENKRRRISMT